MAVRVLFRCEHCDARPDRDTQRMWQGQLRDRSFGKYLDAQPGGWLTWTGGGGLSSTRYACPQHHGDLTDHLRAHYGPRSEGWRIDPYRALWSQGFSGLGEREVAELFRPTGCTRRARRRRARPDITIGE